MNYFSKIYNNEIEVNMNVLHKNHFLTKKKQRNSARTILQMWV